MVTPRPFRLRHTVCYRLGALLALMGLLAIAWGRTATAAEPTVPVTELERLVQQIEDPQQRAQLLETLRTLIAATKQRQAGVAIQKEGDPISDQSQGLFLAFGELTQHLAPLGQKMGQGIATLPMLLRDLPARLTQPATFRPVIYTGVAAGILLTLGIILQLIPRRLQRRFRLRHLTYAPLPRWRKVWIALVTVGLAVAPYAGLLVISGIVFSILPTGAMPAGLAALMITTLLLYHLFRAIALVLLDPDTPNTRLLPIGDNTARRTWRWVARLIALAALYFLISHSLLTIGVDEEFYQVVRGIMLIIVAGVLSVLIAHLARVQHTPPTLALEHDRRLWSGVVAAVQKIWPVIAIAYVWCAALLAVVSYQSGVSFMLAAPLQMALVIGVIIMLLWGVDLLFSHVVALNDRVRDYLPGLEARTLRYLKTVWWSLRLLIVGVGLLTFLQVWGVDIAWFFTSPLGGSLLTRLITLLVTVASVMVVVDLSSFISQRLIEPAPGAAEASKKRQTLVPLIATAMKYGALCMGGLIVLHQIGVNITPILAGVGILSLAVGFGAQTLVKDIINGLFILVEDSMSVGDVVNIRGTGGLVEAVNLRTIQLRDLQGSVHIIPNSQVEIITNMTKAYSYYLLDVGVAYHEDTDEVIAALQEVDAEMRGDPTFAADMLVPIEILGVDRFTDSAVVIRARLKTKPIKQWSVGREFNRRMKKLFDARGIEIPFPQRTIHWGDRKRGVAAPMPLQNHTPDALPTPAERGEGQGPAYRRGDTPDRD